MTSKNSPMSLGTNHYMLRPNKTSLCAPEFKWKMKTFRHNIRHPQLLSSNLGDRSAHLFSYIHINITWVARKFWPVTISWVQFIDFSAAGSVLAFLRKNRGHIEEDTKIRFATESAAGLAYLEKLHFIHR